MDTLNWQTVTALAIVVITLTIFVVRLTKPKSKRDCGHNCGCGKNAPKSPIGHADHTGHNH
jgi:hypothetical protein